MKNQLKNDKLIADFLNLNVTEMQWRDNPESLIYCDKDGQVNIGEIEYFSVDWNLLMSVVEKIESLEFRFEIALDEVDLYCISLDDSRRFSISVNVEEYDETLGKKGAVYNTVVKFIIWYNEQN